MRSTDKRFRVGITPDFNLYFPGVLEPALATVLHPAPEVECETMADTGGYYYEPTIFDGVNNGMRIAQEEIFGPVMSVIGFKDADEAVAIANDSIYGLAGAVWSNDFNTAHKVAAAVRVGTMGINNYFGGDITVPFGGFKQSGNGRDKSMHAFDDYTELKTTWIEFD